MYSAQPRGARASRSGCAPGRRIFIGLAALLGLGVITFTMPQIRSRTEGLSRESSTNHELVSVDLGDVEEFVTAYGTLESGDDAVVRCQVESFLSLPARTASDRPGQPVRISRPRSAATTTQAGPGSSTSAPAPTSQGKNARSADRFASVKSGGSGASQEVSKAAPNATGKQPDSSSRASAQEPAPLPRVPVIRSFQYVVAPYVPLRTDGADATVSAGPPPPPPTILSIVPEGTKVKAGEIVCELDSSAFRRELLAQKARQLRAKGWVDKVRSILEVNEITLREFENGIFPQDVEQIRQLILTCETERQLAERNLDWSRNTADKGFRSRQQVEVDEFTLEKSEIALADARGMLNRLVNYTGKKLVKAIKAKIEANRADRLSLESSSQLESERLKRIEAMIANCTLRAPRDGMVIHANRSNAWGQTETSIHEGVTVYQSQPIFRILDPAHVQIKARINESQIAKVRTGQPALVRFDAYPDRLLQGTVADIAPIPALASGPISDVHTCFATVRFDARGLETLQLGLSAEVNFLVETRRQVTRIPMESIRFANNDAYAAVPHDDPDGPGWRWIPIELGASDPSFAEVRSGLSPGDQVIARSGSLPPPESDPIVHSTDVALAR